MYFTTISGNGTYVLRSKITALRSGSFEYMDEGYTATSASSIQQATVKELQDKFSDWENVTISEGAASLEVD